jgi:hypothetical protein
MAQSPSPSRPWLPLTAEGRHWLETSLELPPPQRATLRLVMMLLASDDPGILRGIQAIVADAKARLSPAERQAHAAAVAVGVECHRQARSRVVSADGVHGFERFNVQNASHCARIRPRGSADHLGGLEEQRRGNGEAQGLSRFEVDDQLEGGGLLDRQVGGLSPVQDAIHIGGREPVPVSRVRSMGHQPAGHDRGPSGNHARQVLLGGERRDPVVVHPDERIRLDEERL